MTPPSAAGLYPQILACHWDVLTEPLRRFYAGTTPARARGLLDIERGASAPSRWLGWLWGMPPRGARVPTELCVERCGTREIWSRRFGAHAWKTQQRLGPAGSLAERRGPIEVWMCLSCADGALCFASIGGALCIASWRLRLPTWVLPQVEARSWSTPGSPEIQLCVTLRAARVGLVARYAGSVCAVRDGDA